MVSEELSALVLRIENALARLENAVVRAPNADLALIERHEKLRATTVEAIDALNTLISQEKEGH